MTAKQLGIDTAAGRKRARSHFGFLLAGVLSAMAFSQAAHAQNLNRVVRFDIRPQSLDRALLQFGRQAHIQVMFASKSLMTKVTTEKLTGTYVARQALTHLLRGTGLWYVESGETVEIVPDKQKELAPDKDSSHSPPRPRRGEALGGDRSMPRTSHGPKEGHNSGNKPDQGDIPRLQEVMVTAQKYRQRAFDVPIDLQVITESELQRRGITSLNQLQYDVPGLYVEGGNVYHYIVLRGVSNESGNGAVVGEYIDDADISADGYAGQVGYGTGNVQLFDLERVEVLKGPQGTLYGDGALGGVIRYITHKPVLNRDETSADVSMLFTQYGAPSQRIEAMLNTPVIAGTLGLRIAGQFAHNGGWVDEPVAHLKNINSDDLTDVRIEALWQPAANFNARATQVIHRESYGIGQGEDAQGNITPVYGVTLVPNGHQSFNLSNLTFTADFSGAQLLSSSTYLKHAEVANNQFYNLPPEVELQPSFLIRNDAFSEELRLHSLTRSPWQWTLGGFFKHYRDVSGGTEYFGPPGSLSSAVYVYLPGSGDQSTAEAAFVDTSFRFLNRVTLGAGARYFQERAGVAGDGLYEDNVHYGTAEGSSQRYTSIDPRAYIQYRLTSDINTYASAAKGFRSGEPNLGEFLGFSPESLWSYDLGAKMRFLRGRLRSDDDAFFENYSNYVGEGLVSAYGVPIFGTFNIGAARIKGVDADVSWISGRWRVSAKGEVVDSTFVSITAGDTGLVVGERLPAIPPYTFVGSIEREFRLDGRPGFALLSYSQTGRVVGYASPVVQSDVIQFLSFRVGVRWNRNLKLSLFGENLLNDRGYLDPSWNEGSANRPRPRTFGIDFSLTLH